jgi:hypothetical protein
MNIFLVLYAVLPLAFASVIFLFLRLTAYGQRKGLGAGRVYHYRLGKVHFIVARDVD